VDNISKVSVSNEKSQEKEQEKGKFFRQRNEKEESSLDKQISWFKKNAEDVKLLNWLY